MEKANSALNPVTFYVLCANFVNTFQVEFTLDDCLSPLPGEVAAAAAAASAAASAAISAGLLFGLPTLVVPSKTV